jgi:hypothetical protein
MTMITLPHPCKKCRHGRAVLCAGRLQCAGSRKDLGTLSAATRAFIDKATNLFGQPSAVTLRSRNATPPRSDSELALNSTNSDSTKD